MAALAFATGCASTDQPVEEADEGAVESEFSDRAEATPVPESDVSDTTVSSQVSRDFDIAPVYFEFDSYEIQDQYGSVLRSAAEALRESGANVVIEGHTDERGSDEYNLALGERRAIHDLGSAQRLEKRRFRTASGRGHDRVAEACE